jgi:MFS family permease
MSYESADEGQIRQARGKFLAMAAAYALGNFTDNFYRQGLALLAIAASLPQLQGWATVVFALPFVLLAAPAGWLADRFAKRRVVVAAKLLEVAAAAVGAAGVLSGRWNLMLAMVALMGLQAAIFGPALNGSIPQLYPAWYVLKANALLKVVTTAGILLGLLGAGLALECPGSLANLPAGRWALAAVVVAAALAGLAVSLRVPSFAPSNPAIRFPWSGPAHTLRTLAGVRRDRLLWQVIWADAFIWLVSSLQVQMINLWGERLGFGPGLTASLTGLALAGLAGGGYLCGRRAALGGTGFQPVPKRTGYKPVPPEAGGTGFQPVQEKPGHRLQTCATKWLSALPAAGAGLAACQALAALVGLVGTGRVGPMPLAWLALAALTTGAGGAAGMWLVPLEAFIQARPSEGDRGRIIAAANATAFVGILLSGLVFLGCSQLPGGSGFFVAAGLSLLAAVLARRMIAEEHQKL